ncbi:Kiwa anti-phage protein KwaB-like domain-containing protein [Mucilaginibacter sp. SG564]|uniref:Kiwa anti-phage protein KwaB-like domain-containing protein n=1 Tax=Mucilaginibacter sp. SG564 TaxID=2587022 RepID=UPI0015580E8D|nr:Kiwa anti-phage protein KwaB-like domain-containing protein [Mucilaginibacter sp. SG564]NOW98961.1 hypothetical protein [Mucilaginibacter sp. SG564]
MDRSALINKLQFVSTDAVGLELYFLHRKKQIDPIEILRVDLEDTSTQSRLESVFINKIKSEFLNQDEEGRSLQEDYVWHLKHIRDVNDLKDTFYYFPNVAPTNDDYHIPEEFKEMVNLFNKGYHAFDVFKHDKHLLDHVFAYLIRLQIDQKQVIIFKQKYPIDILSRSTVLKVIDHASRFVLETDPLLKISDKIDFMLVDNHFIIVNLKLLETKYGFNDRYLKMGTQSLEIIKNKNVVSDTSKIEELAKTVGFSKKLMKVKADNIVLGTPIVEIKLFLEEYKTIDGAVSLSKRIKYIPAQNRFEVKSKEAARDFIKLLNDEYLISLLTKRPYVSTIKEEFENNE